MNKGSWEVFYKEYVCVGVGGTMSHPFQFMLRLDTCVNFIFINVTIPKALGD